MAFDAIMPDGKTLQIGTIHNLGQTFAKTFDITFEDKDGEHKLVYQTCAGLSDRVIASAIGIHGGEELKKEFEAAGLRVNIDNRDIRPGKKFYDWELKGTPIKLELGPRDLENNKTIAMRRDQLEKIELDLDENLVSNVIRLIDELNENLAESAKEFHTDHIKFASDIDEVRKLIEEGNVVAVNWCGDTDCGEKIEEITGYSVLGIYEELEEAGKKCILSDEDAKYVALIAKTY